MPRRAVGFALVALSSWPALVRAQQPTETTTVAAPPPVTTPSSKRAIDEHVFIPSELLVQPFCDTRFRSTTGFAMVRATAPTLDLLGSNPDTNTHFSQAGYTQSFELQVGLLPWLALRANAGATIYSGLSGRAILRLGSVLQFGAGGGITIGQTFGHVRVAILGDLQYSPTSSVDVLGAIVSSIEQSKVDTSPLVTTDHVKPLRVGLSAALPLGSAFGVIVESRYQHTYGGAAPFLLQDSLMVAGAVDFDLKPITPVPIGFLVAYQAQIPLGSDDRKTLWQSLNAGLFYTGRTDLALGLELSGRRVPQRANVISEGVVGSLVTRYYW